MREPEELLMCDVFPAPTPTNEQQDAREEVTTPAERDMVEAVLRAAILRHWPDADEECRSQDDTICEGFDDCLWDIANDVLTALAATRPAPLAVSAAAPDEREALARVLAADDLTTGRVGANWTGIGDDGRAWYFDQADAAVAWFAARPAPVVSGADVLRDAAEAANREWLRLKDGPWGSNPTDQAIIEFATRAIAWLNARADALTVADAPAAEDCARCGGSGEEPDPDPHDERFYRCSECGGTGERPPTPAADEGERTGR